MMIVVSILILALAGASNWLFAAKLSELNTGHRIPMSSARFAVQPPARLRIAQALSMIAAILGATLLSRQFYESSPLLGILLGILSAAIPVGIPIAIVIFRHNKSIGAPA